MLSSLCPLSDAHTHAHTRLLRLCACSLTWLRGALQLLLCTANSPSQTPLARTAFPRPGRAGQQSTRRVALRRPTVPPTPSCFSFPPPLWPPLYWRRSACLHLHPHRHRLVACTCAASAGHKRTCRAAYRLSFRPERQSLCRRRTPSFSSPFPPKNSVPLGLEQTPCCCWCNVGGRGTVKRRLMGCHQGFWAVI